MRKLTKKALSLVLCLMLVVSAISCAFSVTAETGYTTVSGNKVYDAPVGLDLSDLSTWINNGDASNPKFVAENGVLKAGPGFNTSWDEIGPARFKVPNVQAGDTVKLKFDFAINLDALGDQALKDRVTGGERVLYTIFRQYDENGTKITDETKEFRISNVGTYTSAEFTITNPNNFFRIIICSANSLRAAWEISNIEIVATYNNTGSDEEEEVIGSTTVNGNTVYDAPVGLDLSDLSTWAGIGDASNPKFVAENGVLMAGPGFNTSWDEIGPARFKVPNVQVGDTIKFSFDLAINTDLGDQSLTDRVNSGERLLWPLFRQYNKAGTKVDEDFFDVNKNNAGTVVSKTFTVADPDEFYRIIIRSANSLKNSWRISNITVTVTHADGTVEKYPATEGGEEGDDTTPEVVHPEYYGPDDKGFNSAPSNKGSASWPCFLKPAADIYNLDFEYGFRYWTGHDCSVSFGNWGGSRAYSFYDLVTEGGNTYIQAKTPYQTTIMTAIFTANNAAAGDELVIIYDAKGADATKLRPFLRQAIIKANNEYDETTGLCTNQTYPSPAWGASLAGGSAVTPEAFAVQTDATGWTTYVMATTDTVKDYTTNAHTSATCLSDVLLQVKLSVSSDMTTGTAIDAAIDNIRIAKVVDGVYTDIATNEVIYTDPTYGKVAKVGDEYFATLEEAIAAANGGTVVLLKDIALEAPITIAKDTTVTIDLNGFAITGVDTTEKSYALIYNCGTLTINDTIGTGKITATATINSGWNRYSSVLSNNPGGKLTVNGGTIEHLGGTDMAYAIDNLTNGKGTYAETIINGGTIKSTYAAIRQFLNGIEAQNILTINGGRIESTNRAIFFQDPSKNANTGTLTVTANAEIYGDIRLSVTEGSTEWPVEVSIAAAALKDGEVTNNYLPDGYLINNGNGTYGVEFDPSYGKVAMIGDAYYATLEEAFAAAQENDTIKLIANVVLDAPLTIAKDAVVTIDLAGFKISYDSAVQGEAMISNKGTLTINDTVGGGEIYYDITDVPADSTYGKGNYTIDNAGTLTLNGGKINIAKLRGHAKYPINNNSTTGDAIFVMNGGSLYNYNTSAIRQFCNSTVYNNSVTINGGLVEGYSAIWVQNPGKNTVNGTLTITGGEIRTTAAAYVNGTAELKDAGSAMYFTIDGEGGAWSETSALVITGGTFNENIYLAEEAPESITTEETATYNGYVELPFVEEYDLETKLYYVKGFKPTGSEETRYGFLMTIGIDSLDYKKNGCGFYVTIGDETQKFVIENGVVWDSLTVELPSGTVELTPVQFGEDNQYIMHYTVYFTEEQLEALGDKEVSVKGFVTTFEGEELTTKTFNCGTLA